MPEETPIDQMSYEVAFSELENIVATLETNQRPLNEAMALFERGQALASRCAALLDQAELKVRTLLPLPTESSSGSGVTPLPSELSNGSGIAGADLMFPPDGRPEE